MSQAEEISYFRRLDDELCFQKANPLAISNASFDQYDGYYDHYYEWFDTSVNRLDEIGNVDEINQVGLTDNNQLVIRSRTVPYAAHGLNHDVENKPIEHVRVESIEPVVSILDISMEEFWRGAKRFTHNNGDAGRYILPIPGEGIFSRFTSYAEVDVIDEIKSNSDWWDENTIWKK